MASSESQSSWTREELLKLGEPSAEFVEALKQFPAFAEIPASYSRDGIPQMRQTPAEWTTPTPEGVTEQNIQIPVRDGTAIPIRIHSPSKPVEGGSPLVVNYHGGGFMMGDLDLSADFCRSLVTAFGAVVIDVKYRLAPEHPFPIPINDAWDALQWAAKNAASFNGNPELGFIAAGISAGANFAAVVSLLARDNKLSPPLTGSFLSALPAICRDNVPEKHKSSWLSYEQNKNAPILNKPLYDFLLECYAPSPTSFLFSPILHPDGFGGLPRTYFVVCGMDPLRDDGIIYERVLREEGIQTKIDIYPGVPHCWWAMLPQLASSKKCELESMEGFKWLLQARK